MAQQRRTGTGGRDPLSESRKKRSEVDSGGLAASPAVNEPLLFEDNGGTPFSHRVLPCFLLSQAFVSLFQMFLGGMWAHVMGVFAAILSLVLALCTFLVTYVERYRPPARWMRGLLMLANFLVAGYVFLLFAVHFIGPDRVAGSFPDACYRDTNCIRLTSNATSNVDSAGLAVLSKATSASQVSTELRRYLLALPRTTMLGSVVVADGPQNNLKSMFFQFRTVSMFMGFPDDSYFLIRCTPTGLTELWIQAEARIGVSDFGVNRDRVVALLDDLNDFTIFTRAACDAVAP